MLGRVKLNNTLLTCDQGNFNQITARGRNRTLVTVVRDTCTTTVPPAPSGWAAELVLESDIFTLLATVQYYVFL